jgi:hypothetical protein
MDRTFEEMKKELMSSRDKTVVLECTAIGPYDGCFHEPNYWLLKDRSIYPLFISGKAWDWFEFAKYDPPWMHDVPLLDFLDSMEETDRYNQWEIIDPEKWELTHYNVLNSTTVLMSQHQAPLPTWYCDRCGNKCTGRAKFLGYCGDGGIGIHLEDPVCDECFNKIRWCDDCIRYVEPVNEGDEYNDEEIYVCPNKDEDDDRKHKLYEVEDEAIGFGLTGDKFLLDGDADGLEGVAIVIMQKGG